MIAQPRSKKLAAFVLLGALALVWGSSFILMKRALTTLQPMQVAALRMVLAFACLSPFLPASLRSVERRYWIWIALVGAVGSGIPAMLFCLAQTNIHSSTAGLLNALSPLFVLLVGRAFFRERVKLGQLVGVLLGLCGAALIILAARSESAAGNFWYALLVVGATICYGFSANIIRHKLQGLSLMQINGFLYAPIALPYLIYLAFSDFGSRFQTRPEIWQAVGYVALLAALGTAISNSAYTQLIRISNPIFASSVTYLIPIVALAWGVADGEALNALHLCGIGVVLAGIALVNKR